MSSRALGLLFCCAVASCKPSAGGDGAPSARPSPHSPSAQPLASSVPPASVVAPLAPPPRGCRIITLTGNVKRLEGAPLSPGESFDGRGWLSFEAGASATFRHMETTREWTLIGPGRMRPCRDGEEQVAIASGRVKTASGAGARPGAEVSLFTPFGVVRYGDATLELDVSSKRFTVVPKSGSVWLETLDDKKETAALPQGKPRTVVGRLSGSELEKRCADLAQKASDAGRALTGAGPTLSAKAVAHLRARREARYFCGAGESFAAGLEGPERGRLLDRYAEFEQLYLALPTSSPRVNADAGAPPRPSASAPVDQAAEPRPSAMPNP